MRDFSLLDYLGWKLHLEYLSELKELSLTNRRRVADILSVLEGYDEFYPEEWVDACEYITGTKADDAAAARMRILAYFTE